MTHFFEPMVVGQMGFQTIGPSDHRTVPIQGAACNDSITRTRLAATSVNILNNKIDNYYKKPGHVGYDYNRALDKPLAS